MNLSKHFVNHRKIIGKLNYESFVMQSFLRIIFVLLAFVHTTYAYQISTVPPSYDIFYLSVGNSRYQPVKTVGNKGQSKTLNGFENIDGANRSAKKIASYLDAIGAIAGITLVSAEDKLVTKKDVFDALDKLLEQANKTKSKNPLIIFYFCGHGLSEGVGWNHFSIPGDYILPDKFIDVAAIAEKTVYAGDVADAIEAKKLPFLMLLDSCYEGKEEPLTAQVFSRQLAQNLTDIFKVLRFMNEFRGPGMAVFATKPGTLSKTVEDPLDTDSSFNVGRIARKTMLIFETAFKAKSNLPIAKFLQQMSDPAFDKATASVITLSTPENPNFNLIKRAKPLRAADNFILGSGELLPPEQLQKNANRAKDDKANSTDSTPVRKVLADATSYLTIESELGEYIGQGRQFTLSAKNNEFFVVQNETQQIVFSITENNSEWEIVFAAPEGQKLSPGVYRNAQRAYFQTAKNAGFNFSGHGRGCGEIQAEFTISEIQWDATGDLLRFVANFIQKCDDAKQTLKGRLDFQASKTIDK